VDRVVFLANKKAVYVELITHLYLLFIRAVGAKEQPPSSPTANVLVLILVPNDEGFDELDFWIVLTVIIVVFIAIYRADSVVILAFVLQ
jgi:hypothetical protein